MADTTMQDSIAVAIGVGLFSGLQLMYWRPLNIDNYIENFGIQRERIWHCQKDFLLSGNKTRPRVLKRHLRVLAAQP